MKVMVFVVLLFSSMASANVNINLSGKTLDEFFIASSEVLKKSIVVDPAVNGKVKIFQVQYSGDFEDVFALVLQAHGLVADTFDDVIRVKPMHQSLEMFFPFFDRVSAAYITSFRISKSTDDFNSIDVDFKVKVNGEDFYVSDRALRQFDIRVYFIDPCLVRLVRASSEKYLTCPPVDKTPYRDYSILSGANSEDSSENVDDSQVD